jgi:hypothetical protein
MGSTQPPIQWEQGIKRQGPVADHSPPTSAEVKKTWLYTSTPPYRDNFTLGCINGVGFPDQLRLKNDSGPWRKLITILYRFKQYNNLLTFARDFSLSIDALWGSNICKFAVILSE